MPVSSNVRPHRTTSSAPQEKMLRAFLATVLGLLASTANAWTLQESVDAMSDKASRQVLVTAPDGSTFTLLRKTDGSIWGYLKITG